MPELVTKIPVPPSREAGANKGDFGRVLIVGGSRGMSGAAVLAGCSALRGGAGLVSLAVPKGILPIVAASEPSYLTIPLPEDPAGRIAGGALEELEKLTPAPSVIAIGPGLGKSKGLGKIVLSLFETIPLPLVVDADGLNLLAERQAFQPSKKPRSLPGPRILTPHPGEFARLTGLTVAEVQKQRDELARRFAKEHGVIVLLKGAATVITDGKQLAINRTGNNGMATGGTGDVLTGLIAALLAQKMTPFDAAQLGAHLHGMAGDLSAEALSAPGMIASDLLKFLPAAWKAILATA